MIQLAKYILSFVSTLVVLCTIAGSVNYYLTYSYPNKNMFSKDPSKHILVLGDSQLECDVDEAYFPTVFNRCKSSDSYLFCYAKLKEMLKSNPQIDTVVLSFSQTSMTPNVDRRMHTEGIDKRLLLYGQYLECEDLRWFSYEEIVDNLLNLLFPSGRPHPETRGGFNKRLASEGFHAPSPTSSGNESEDVDYTNECANYYISKIDVFCRDRGIALLLLTPPMYSGVTRDEYWEDTYKTLYSHIKHIDCEGVIPDSLFYDSSHLNEYGARFFSEMLKVKFADNESSLVY